MITYNEAKTKLRNDSLRNYLELQQVESNNFKIDFIDKRAAFFLFFDQVEEYLEAWVNSLNNEIEMQNLKKEPDYAFMHYIAKTIFPNEFGPEVGGINIDEESLAERGLDVNSFIQGKGEFNFRNWYADEISDVFSINEDHANITDMSAMFDEYRQTSLKDHSDVMEKWQDIYFNEFELIIHGMLVSFGKTALEMF